MSKFNILFLGGAKRVSMARMLIAAGKKRGLDVGIFSYELTDRVPVALVGEVIIGYRWRDPRLMDHLRETVREKDINVMIPFVDGAVEIAALCRDSIPGVWAPVGTVSDSRLMFNKIESARIFEEAGLSMPETYTPDHYSLPAIAKPCFGSASNGIRILTTKEDFAGVDANQYLLQEYIADREEYTVDCYVDHTGRICCVSPRLRIEVVSGEVSRTRTVGSPDIIRLARLTLERLGLRGAVTIQMLRDKPTGRLMLMEINPRLGGGAVCSVHAGADLPGMIIDEARGLPPVQAADVQPDVEIVRYFDEAVFYGKEKE